jgi:hypothetical protein
MNAASAILITILAFPGMTPLVTPLVTPLGLSDSGREAIYYLLRNDILIITHV